MAFNPAKQTEALNSPVQRASNLNDPQFENQQGYFPYDLTHCEYITPLFGQITPTMHLDTVPGDRTVVHDNVKTILNQINGNFLSTVNQYVDSFYVPFRSVFPMNYEKLIPNPTKGDDLPNSALPQVPLFAMFNEYLRSSQEYEVDNDGSIIYFVPRNIAELMVVSDFNSQSDWDTITSQEPAALGTWISRLILLATVLSRGQLMDYLGLGFDDVYDTTSTTSSLQKTIDQFFSALYECRDTYMLGDRLYSGKLDPIYDGVIYSMEDTYIIDPNNALSTWRSAIADILEKGQMVDIRFTQMDQRAMQPLFQAIQDFMTAFDSIFESAFIPDDDIPNYISIINNESDPFANGSHINIGKILAYQQIVAQYYTNDTIDNIYTSDLFMQLLRGVMYPADDDGFTTEPTFTYNGVATEYDYISAGGFATSLLQDRIEGHLSRQYLWMTIMLLMRRSLRYGDYFSTARPNMLAIGQLSIPADDSGNVSPIDVTKNLLMQRYLNAANYIGQGFLQYMSSVFGIKPSDAGTFPRFVAHRKIELTNQITNNTAENQGAQTTNLVGYADTNAFDVFIDDLGYLISLTSYDVLPVYTSGIENTYHFADRFDYFNPMLQGIGDQPIRSSEILGAPELRNKTFGYTMRNGEYKYKLSKAHGAFVNSLPGFLLKYPLSEYRTAFDEFNLNINPDFIRDKPIYLDPVIPQMTGRSPGDYYHFVCACNNQVLCARKIQATPGVLF